MDFIFSKKNLLTGSLILFSGCLSLSDEHTTQNLLSPPSIARSVEKGLDSPYFSKGDWPQENWWEIFHSQQLNSLIAKALDQNPTIQGIKKRVEFAKQTAKVTKSRLFPLISFDANESWEYLSHNGLYRTLDPTVPINANLIDLTLSFTYEFDFWGKNRNLFQAALGQNKAQEAESAQVELITTTAVAQSYFALKTNLLRQHLYEKLYEVRNNTFQLQKLLWEKALSSKFSPLLAEENLLETKKMLVSINEEVATNRHLINILIGVGPDEPLEIDGTIESLQKSVSLPKDLSLDLLARRPDLMAQIWRVEALAHDVGAAKADFFPNINLTAFAGLESVLYSLLFNSRSETQGLQPAIHLPIFTAGAIRANIKAKKASFDEAVYDYNQLLLRSSQEVADLLVLVDSVFEQKKKQEHIVENALERFELTLLRKQKGLDNQLESYAFQEALIEKELENVHLLYGQYLATIKLIKALGGGYHSEYLVPLRAASTSEEG